MGWLAASLLVGACTSTMVLLPREGGESVTGTISFSGVIAVSLLGRDYQGNYYTTDGGLSTGTYSSYAINSSGNGAHGGGARMGTFQSYLAPKNARALLVATDGTTLRCEFTFGGDGGVGSCTTNDSHEYDVLIKSN